MQTIPHSFLFFNSTEQQYIKATSNLTMLRERANFVSFRNMASLVLPGMNIKIQECHVEACVLEENNVPKLSKKTFYVNTNCSRWLP